MNIKKRIELRGFTHKFVASSIGVNYNTFRRYINDDSCRPESFVEKVELFLSKKH